MSSSQQNAPALNTTICVIASAFAGIGVGFFGCLLSSADKKRQLNGGQHSRDSQLRFRIGAAGSTLFGILSLVGLAYGPVALVVVVRAGATLPANAFFSQVFHLRPLLIEDYLGMLITLSGVVSFTISQGDPGPEVTVPAFLEFITRPVAIVWNCACIVLLLLSVVLLMDCRNRSCMRMIFKRRCQHRIKATPSWLKRLRLARKGQLAGTLQEASAVSNVVQGQDATDSDEDEDNSSTEAVQPLDSLRKLSRREELVEVLSVVIITSCSSACMDLAAKGWSSPLKSGIWSAFRSALFWLSILVNLIFLVGMRVGTIMGCNRCDVLLFVPLNTVMNILVSVATGLVVLQEWRGVTSWVGLASASLSMLGGIVMLVAGPAQHPEVSVISDDSRPTSVTTSQPQQQLRASSSSTRAAQSSPSFSVDESISEESDEDSTREPNSSRLDLLIANKIFALDRLNRYHTRAAQQRASMEHEIRFLRSTTEFSAIAVAAGMRKNQSDTQLYPMQRMTGSSTTAIPMSSWNSSIPKATI